MRRRRPWKSAWSNRSIQVSAGAVIGAAFRGSSSGNSVNDSVPSYRQW
jgi:hypothetical protein